MFIMNKYTYSIKLPARGVNRVVRRPPKFGLSELYLKGVPREGALLKGKYFKQMFLREKI